MSKQLVIAAAGAAVGFAVGGPQGAVYGYQIGSAIGGVAFAETQKSQGPRLSDLAVSGTVPGPIPYIEGQVRTSGQIIWSSNRREIATTTEQGKGGPSAESTTYTYEVDLLYLLSDNELDALSRVWSNGKLVFSRAAGADLKTFISSLETEAWKRITFYSGSVTQLPDPTYEAAVGLGNAPAYRGRACVFIESLQLGGSGQIPNLSFEVMRDATTADVAATFATCSPVGAMAYQAEAVYKDAAYFLHNDGGNSLFFTLYKSKNYGPFKKKRALTYPGASNFFPPCWVTTNGRPQFVYQTFDSNSFSDPITVYSVDAENGAITTLLRYVPGDSDGTLRPLQGHCAYDEVQDVYVFGPRNFLQQAQIPFVIRTTGGSDFFRFTSTIFGLRCLAAWNGHIYALTDAGGAWRVQRWNYSGSYVDEVVDATGSYGGSDIVFYSGCIRVDPDGQCWVFNQYSGRLFRITTFFEEVSTASTPVTYNSGIKQGVFYNEPEFVAWGRQDRLPQFRDFTFKRFKVPTPVAPTLQTAVQRLCARADLEPAQYDASALSTITKPVRSMAISQTTPIRQVLEQLAGAYFFGGVVSDKLYFRPRGSASVATIPYRDIGAGEGDAQSEPLNLKIQNELEVPAQIALTYSNVDGDYNIATEYSDRLLTSQTSTSAIQVPLGFTPFEAKSTADSLVADSAASIFSTTITVLNEYARIEPTDVITVVDEDGSTYRMRVTRKTESGPVISLDLILDDASALISSGVTSGDYSGSTVVSASGETDLRLLDIPLLRDADDQVGLYVAVAPTNSVWPGAAVFKSVDGAVYEQKYTIPDKTVMGLTTTALTAWTGGFVFDESSRVTIEIDSGTLSSYTRDNIFDGTAPAYLVGSEIVYARTAILVSAGVYELSGFLRGMRGTEWAMSGHVAGEEFTILSTSGLRREVMDTSEIGALRYYKAPTLGRALSTAEEKTITLAAISKKPFSPVNLRAKRSFLAGAMSNVTLLLHMAGKPGVVTFLDSSPADNVPTAFGASAISTAQAKFGVGSAFFDGSGGVSYPTGANFQFPADFTIECWIRPTSTPVSGGPVNAIFSHYAVAQNTTGLIIYFQNQTLYFFSNGNQITSAALVLANTWQHVAVSRVGTSIRMFLDGVQVGSTFTSAANYSDGRCFVGRDSTGVIQHFNGFIDDVRVTKGVGRYSANFTPPTAQFDYTDANFASVTLLLNMNNVNTNVPTIIDSSQTPKTITPLGDAAISSTQSKFGGTSMLCNGTNAALTAATGVNFQFSGDFTVEGWVYMTTASISAGASKVIFDCRSTTVSSGGFALYQFNADLVVYSNGANRIVGTSSFIANTWQHVALTRSGTTVRAFVNGVQVGSSWTTSINFSDGLCSVGKDSSVATGYFDGYIDEFRITKAALYTASFTPSATEFPEPWAVDQNFSSVSLLLHFDGTDGQTTTTDSGPLVRPVTLLAGAALSTALPKFGASSLSLTASGHQAIIPTAASLEFGAGDFTVELWVYQTATNVNRSLLCHHVTDDVFTNIQFIIGTSNSGSGFSFQVFIGGVITVAASATGAVLNQWQHIAAVRTGTTITLYVDGVSVGTATPGSGPLNAPASANLRVGGRVHSNVYQFIGSIEDLRITKGVARYTAAFIPPASRFQDLGPQTAGIDLSWDRRTRYAKNFTNGFVPLAEDSEAYDVDVFADGTYSVLKRTLTSTTPLVNYSDANQVTDFGALQPTVYVDVYQKSAAVGRGYKLRGAV